MSDLGWEKERNRKKKVIDNDVMKKEEKEKKKRKLDEREIERVISIFIIQS